MFSRRSLILLPLILAGVAAMATPSYAEDPKARALLEKISETYRTLDSYYFEGTMAVVVSMSGYEQSVDMKLVLARTADGKLRMELDHPSLGVTVVSDGESTWKYSPAMNAYSREPGVAINIGDKDDEFGWISDWMVTFRDIDTKSETARLIGDDVIKSNGEHVVCTVVEVTYRTDPETTGVQHWPDTLWVDETRHVVLRETTAHEQKSARGVAKIHQNMTFHEAHANEQPPSWLFVFNAPVGAKEVPKLSRAGAGHDDNAGQAAADFDLTDLRGDSYSLTKLKGKVVMLDFWATWCAPCRREMPHLQKLYSEYKDKGLVLLGVNQEHPEQARNFMKQYKLTFPSLIDRGGVVTSTYGVRGLPTVVVIDREGVITAHLLGLRGEEELRSVLKKAGVE
jgi:peroxiredoxin/outer membrane lipoprotein-sorting protein